MGWNGTIFTKGGVRSLKAGEEARAQQRREREEGSMATRRPDVVDADTHSETEGDEPRAEVQDRP